MLARARVRRRVLAVIAVVNFPWLTQVELFAR
jgi:hypothetical protein